MTITKRAVLAGLASLAMSATLFTGSVSAGAVVHPRTSGCGTEDHETQTCAYEYTDLQGIGYLCGYAYNKGTGSFTAFFQFSFWNGSNWQQFATSTHFAFKPGTESDTNCVDADSTGTAEKLVSLYKVTSSGNVFMSNSYPHP